MAGTIIIVVLFGIIQGQFMKTTANKINIQSSQARQKSTYSRFGKYYTTDLALDGKLGTDHSQCSSTRFEDKPWFYVYFQEEQTVDRFRILSPKSCVLNCRLNQMTVRIGYDLGNVERNPICVVASNVPEGKWVEFKCKRPLKGRYLHIQLPFSGLLSICELEVFSPATLLQDESIGQLARREVPYDENRGRCDYISFHEESTTWCTNNLYQTFAQVNGRWELVSGRFKRISVGAAGVWGVNANNKACYRQGVSEEKPEGLIWTEIDGNITHISSGPEGIVWGINNDGQTVCREQITCDNPTGYSWKIVTGGEYAQWISCNNYGCWMLRRDGSLFFRTNVTKNNCAGSNWRRTDYNKANGDFVSIESSHSGKRAIAVDRNNHLYESLSSPDASSRWTRIGKGRYNHATPARLGVIATTTNSQIVFLAEVPECTRMSHSLTQIDAGKGNSVCGTLDGNIYQKQGKHWILMDGSMDHISCSEHQMWGINRYNSVFFRTSTNCSNHFGSGWERIPGKLKQIDVGHFGQVYGVDFNDRILKRTGITRDNPKGNTWVAIAGRLSRVSCCDYGCWGVSFRKTVFMRSEMRNGDGDGKKNLFKSVNGRKMEKVEAGENGLVFAVSDDNTVWARIGISRMNQMGSGWIQFYRDVSYVAANQREMYVIDVQKKIRLCTLPDF